MNKLILIASLFIVLNAFGQTGINQVDAAGKKQGLWQKKQENGKLLYEGSFKDDRPVGEFKRYHSNGMVKAIIQDAENSDSSYAKMFDVKGKLMAEGAYLNQQKTGKWSYFGEGKLVSQENYQVGLKEGKSRTYYPSGELFEETDWERNQQTGVYRAYFTNGKPYLECQMKEGKRDGFCQVFRENGDLELEGFYQNGLRHNEWKYYDETGNYSHSFIYDLGLLMNPEVRDSLEQIRFRELEENRHKLVDPEKFMDNPMEYMQRSLSPQ
ncbi:toxin-antitoxin system YwqK family antitoxin [Gaoshiqia sediminis]|uniref:Toxin-antitoxin system YwqK family antitoxin n=1 Tax=Gaoshiqia sediminis TaxID=2986998 RepID=A0AA41Y643_9BACT|nr:toxin-antitoxin system YwqK family antitoxin [Gaoshiqia sediminis]MCW0482535.1 toxin-antitoxin system YwqK family antitoxin [Gaoshiqia sediminis]